MRIKPPNHDKAVSKLGGTVIGVESENADSEAAFGQNGYAVSVNAEPETIIDVGV